MENGMEPDVLPPIASLHWRLVVFNPSDSISFHPSPTPKKILFSALQFKSSPMWKISSIFVSFILEL
jgi:hypothetical protein